jgi:hypothetical protein
LGEGGGGAQKRAKKGGEEFERISKKEEDNENKCKIGKVKEKERLGVNIKTQCCGAEKFVFRSEESGILFSSLIIDTGFTW